MAERTREEYVRLAEDALNDLVRQEGAVLMREAEARISASRYPKIPIKVNPHHLTTARASLLKRSWITLSEPIDDSGTRLLLPGDKRGRKTAINKATKRKTALHKRMETWARPSGRYRNGLIGEAGERVVRRSLVAAAQDGCVRPINPGGASVTRLFDSDVPGGPLDTGAWIDFFDDFGRAIDSALCPIEVKNIRHWVYPRSHELFQLLYKCAKLQEAAPEVDICPILVAPERAHIANEMSRDLGFRILDIHKQFVLPVSEVTEKAVEELHTELGYTNLVRSQDADATLTTVFAGSMRRGARPNATKWRACGSQLTEFFEELRDSGLSGDARAEAMVELREAADEVGAWSGIW